MAGMCPLKMNHPSACRATISENCIVSVSTTIVRIESPIESSYEIICAPLRMAPMSEYLLLLLHPASRMPTIPIDEAAIMKKTPTLKSRISIPLLKGRQENASTEARMTMYGARL